MEITFTCPHCGVVTLVDERFIGQSGQCRSCDRGVTVPHVKFSDAPSAVRGASGSSRPRRSISLTFLNVLIGVVIVAVLGYLLLPNGVSYRTGPRRPSVMNHLKQIALAMHNYHDTYNSLPRAYFADDQGRRTDSWRVQLLPFLDQEEAFQAYQKGPSMTKTKRNALRKRLGHYFHDPSDGSWQPEHTSFMVVSGPGTMFEEGRDLTFADCKDGASNTILAVEVKKSNVNWDDPVDLDIRTMVMRINASDRNGLGDVRGKGACVAMLDGSVRFLDNKTLESTLRAMITRAGGEMIDQP